MVPFTCSRKFKVTDERREKKEKRRSVSDPLVVNGSLAPNCIVAIKEIFARFDADLDGLLNLEEATLMFGQILGEGVVCSIVHIHVYSL